MTDSFDLSCNVFIRKRFPERIWSSRTEIQQSIVFAQLGVHRFENQIRRERRCDNIWTKSLKYRNPYITELCTCGQSLVRGTNLLKEKRPSTWWSRTRTVWDRSKTQSGLRARAPSSARSSQSANGVGETNRGFYLSKSNYGEERM